MLVLKNARLLPELTEGFAGSRGDVVLEGNLIREVVPAGTAFYPGAETFDMTGKTFIPGLIEAHLHLDLCGMNTFEENVQPDAYRVMRAVSLAQEYLRTGYTTIRDVGDRNNIIISVARAFDEGLVPGPTVLASGKILSPTESGNEFFGDMYLEADSPEEFRKAVRTQYQAGAKWIKIMGTGAVMNPGAEPGAPIIMEEELLEACKTAAFVNRPVAVHCHGKEGIKMCIRCGVRTVEHSSVMDEECIRMYLAQDKTYMIPTVSSAYAFAEIPGLVPEFMSAKSRKVVKLMAEGTIAAYEAGVKMGWGTDAGVYAGSHGNGLYEFRCRVHKLGFSPLDTLIQITKNNAEILYIDDQVGTIAPGKIADLVAIDGNPDQDIERIAAVAAVFKGGRLVKL